MTRLLRTWRNRLLRLRLIRTRHFDRASRSKWTWGSDGKVAWISPLSLLHDLADAFGFKLYLRLPDDPGTVPADDPRWDTEAKLVIERPLDPAKLTYGLDWCDCGAQMAADDKNRRWDCSDIMLGIATPKDQEGSLRHSDVKPYAFWKVRIDQSGKAPVRREPRNQPTHWTGCNAEGYPCTREECETGGCLNERGPRR